MAITANAIVVKKTPLEGDWKWASLYSADLSGAEDLVAATTNKCIYVNRVIVSGQSVTDLTVTLGAAQSTGVTTIYLGPIPLSDTGSSIDIDFGPDECMQVAVSTAFSVDSSGAGVVNVLVKYKVADA